MPDSIWSAKLAIISIKEAGDFGYNMVDFVGNISEEIVDSHYDNYKNLSVAERISSDWNIREEIGARLNILNLLHTSFIVVQFTIFDNYLQDAIESAARHRNVLFTPAQLDPFTDVKALDFLQGKLGFSLPDPWPAWNLVCEFRRLRDMVGTHSYRVPSSELAFLQEMQQRYPQIDYEPDSGSLSLGEELLEQACSSMIAFFQELESVLKD